MPSRIFCKSLALTILATLFILLGHLPALSIYGTSVGYPCFQKWMSYVTWTKEGFASATSDQSLKDMAEVGTNFVSLVVTWYQKDYNSTEMEKTDRSPSDKSVRHAISRAHSLGMSVLLKPHIDLIATDGSINRSDIGFQTDEKWKEWFVNYSRFIKHYAAMAEKEGVEIFCIGTELSFASTKRELWEEMVIAEVRKNFSGRITYAANWDEYKNVKFWDKLDYAGIDAYFPISKKDNPALWEIKRDWRVWLREVEKWQRGVRKPVIFTECGYPSVDSAARRPWEEVRAGDANQRLQADCYNALFDTFWNKEWFFGAYWWNWNTYPGSGGPDNKGFTPQNKPALECIRQWYAKNMPQRIFEDDGKFYNDAELENKIDIISRKESVDKQGAVFTGQIAGRDDARNE